MAANALRGEATLAIGDKAYKLVYDANAFCYAEQALGKTTDEITEAVNIMQREGKANLTLIRGVIYAGLQQHHECHLLAAGEIVADAGLAAAKRAMFDGMIAAFGAADAKVGEDGDEADPPKAPGDGAGTG